jgi:hypothetical protein
MPMPKHQAPYALHVQTISIYHAKQQQGCHVTIMLIGQMFTFQSIFSLYRRYCTDYLLNLSSIRFISVVSIGLLGIMSCLVVLVFCVTLSAFQVDIKWTLYSWRWREAEHVAGRCGCYCAIVFNLQRQVHSLGGSMVWQRLSTETPGSSVVVTRRAVVADFWIGS